MEEAELADSGAEHVDPKIETNGSGRVRDGGAGEDGPAPGIVGPLRVDESVAAEIEIVFRRELIADGTRVRPQRPSAQRPLEIRPRVARPTTKITIELTLDCSTNKK